MSNTLRITGMASGLDVDSMVTQMLKASQMKIDKVKQDRQIIQWKQDLYRDLIGSVNTFKSNYFDVLKPDTYMLSPKTFSTFDTTSADTASITASAGAVAGDYKVTVSQLAEKASISGTNTEINVKEAANDFLFPAEITAANRSFDFKFADGSIHTVALTSADVPDGPISLTDLASKINTKLASATNDDISNQVVATVDGQKIKFTAKMNFTADQTINIVDTTDGNKIYSITIGKGNYTLNALASTINSKLKAASDPNGKTVDISGKLTAAVSDDGSKVTFTNDGANVMKVSGSLDTIYDTKMQLVQTSNPNATAVNTLEYDRKIFAGFNDTLYIKVDAKQYKITLNNDTDGVPGVDSYGKPSGGTADPDVRSALLSKIQSALTTAVDISDNSSKNLTADYKISARLSLDGTRIQFVSNTNKSVNISGNAGRTIGFTSNFDVNQSTDDKMSIMFSNIADPNNRKVDFKISNGTTVINFLYDFNAVEDVVDPATNQVTVVGAKNKTISDIITDISAKANAKLSYSQLTRKFVLESNATGSTQSISISTDTTNASAISTTNTFLTTLFGGTNLTDNGQDAIVIIKNPNAPPDPLHPGDTIGVQVTKSTNSFTIDGVNYNLIKPGEEKTLSLTSNVQKSFDKIKDFVDKYNETIDKINQKLSERKQYKYPPLTDDQKKDMKDDDIKNWEAKAKEGLLSNDSTLENMLSSMRRAFFDPVKGYCTDPDGTSIGISLSDIGLSTSSDISERGKIIIDETKLKNALQNNGDKVTQLFTKASTTESFYSPDLSYTERQNRYNEEGIFQRLNDIFQDNIRTSRNINGKKGIFLEKAGIKGDFTEFHNMLTDDLNDKDKMIDDLNQKLSARENQYYLQFSKLEQAMQQMNSQSSWLSQQLAGMSGGR